MASEGQNDATAIEFKHFDVVPEASDHHFIYTHQSVEAKAAFDGLTSKKVMKEWRILEENLPESIYVQVYETRIDLLRAVIIGAPGTPYHDGLFFFDILLPSDYPRKPPKVYYHSHGHRLNPNLYCNGTVCLSLLNTWNGSKTEKWSQNSTILQVLVSIQGLVLNSRPYFNEPGFAKYSNRKSYENYSLSYNQGVFILSCKTMLYKMRTSPKNFEGFVAQHFRTRADCILAAIEAYRDGNAQVGKYQGKSSAICLSKHKVSPSFKKSLKNIHSDLIKAFRALDVLPNRPEIGTQLEEKEMQKHKKKGLLKNIISTVKQIFK